MAQLLITPIRRDLARYPNSKPGLDTTQTKDLIIMNHTKKIAILQKGYGIFGTGESLTEAIENAKEWLHSSLHNELGEDLLYIATANDSDLCWAYCTDRLAHYVGINGTPDTYDEDDYVLDLDARHLELLGLSE